MQRLLARCQLIYTKEHQQKISEVLDFATKNTKANAAFRANRTSPIP